MILPTEYKPQRAADFIGDAHDAARLIENTVAASKPDGLPMKFLFNGPPGVGKSKLAEYFISLLGAGKWSITKLNGTGVKLEWVEKFAQSNQLTGFFDEYRIVWIDEADKIPPIAQVGFLTLLDDLPKKTAVVCTSNCNVDEFQNRFQTRFLTVELTGPSANEIYKLLDRISPAIARQRQADVMRIAELAAGNVRHALNELQLLIMSLA